MFLGQRRQEHAASGITVPDMTLKAEWKSMTAGERGVFELAAKERRACKVAVGFATFLQRQQLQQHAAPRVRPINPNDAPLAKRRRTAKPEAQPVSSRPVLQVPQPVFPSRAVGLAPPPDRLLEMATLRAQAEGALARLRVVSSRGVDLSAVSARLSAPTLSCDWQCDVEDREEGDPQALLEVGMPADCQVRGLLREELQQRISSAQVSLLARGRGREPRPPEAQP